MIKKISVSILGFLTAIMVIVGLTSCRERQSNSAVPSTKVAKKTSPADNAPTIYLHGYGAGARSTNSMIAYAEQHNYAHKVLTATILKNGKVSLKGNWPKKTKRPLIQVVLQDNKNSDYYTTREWFHNLIVVLQKKYHVKQYNTVAHSMGNLMTLSYQMKYGQKAHLPRLKNQVNLGAPFNGIIGLDDSPNHNYLRKNGQPKYTSIAYRNLLREKNGFPSGVRVLNIFGNKEDGTNSDDDVSVVSARSLSYLLKGKTKSYREIEIRGAGGQHSRLHENSRVAYDIGNFLWQN